MAVFLLPVAAMPTKRRPSLPPVFNWPEGGELFAEIAKLAAPSITDEQCRALALAFLDTPATPLAASDWKPGNGRDARRVLVQETTVAALLLQAWSDRAAWAQLHCRDPIALRNYKTALQVMRASTRYLFLDLEESQ